MSTYWRSRDLGDHRAAAMILKEAFDHCPRAFVLLGIAAFWAIATWVGIMIWKAF